MTTPENRFKKDLVTKMGTRWVHQSHEDKFSESIADLSYSIRGGYSGWIELKHVEAWPKRPETTIKFKHFKAGQVNWANSRSRLGTVSLFVCKVGSGKGAEYFIFHAHTGSALRDGMSQALWMSECAFYSQGMPDPKELIDFLIKYEQNHKKG